MEKNQVLEVYDLPSFVREVHEAASLPRKARGGLERVMVQINVVPLIVTDFANSYEVTFGLVKKCPFLEERYDEGVIYLDYIFVSGESKDNVLKVEHGEMNRFILALRNYRLKRYDSLPPINPDITFKSDFENNRVFVESFWYSAGIPNPKNAFS